MKPLPTDNWERIVCLGAHSDDIEIGCGGTLLHLMRKNPNLTVHWHVFSGNEQRTLEAKNSAEYYFSELADQGNADSRPSITVHQFRDAHFPAQLVDIKQTMQEILRNDRPDVVFTHQIADRHQDHRTLGEVAWQTFRDHTILEYEIPKFEGDLVQPNVFVPLTAEVCQRKIDLLETCFPSQKSKPWYDQETFRSLLRIRGLECHSHSRYAEAFTVRKMTID